MSQIVAISAVGPGIAQLTIDDPASQNRLSDALCAALAAALAELARDEALKVLILAGRDDVFCAGATLETLRALAAGAADVRDLALPDQLLAFPVPLVGALRGHAVGGGLALALCCDLLVASASSRYGVNFTSMGFSPGMGTTALLPALVGHHFASEMILSARFYKGRELDGRGLFNYVVPAEQVLPTALDLARRIAEQPRHVLTVVKEALALPRRQALQAAMAREHLMHKVCFSQPGAAELIEQRYLE